MKQFRIQFLKGETMKSVADFLSDEFVSPDHFAFCAAKGDRIKGVLVGHISSGQLEILELNDHAQFQEEVWSVLLEAAVAYARLENAGRLIYRYFGLDEQLVVINTLLQKNGWSEPQIQWQLMKINTLGNDPHRLKKSYHVAGEVVPLLDLPVEMRVRFLESHDKSYRFTDFKRVIRELSLAYVENEEILGYVLFIQNGNMLEAVQSLVPEGCEAKVVLIFKIAEAYRRYNVTDFVLRVNSQYQGRISEGLFKNQICWRGAHMYTEKEL